MYFCIRNKSRINSIFFSSMKKGHLHEKGGRSHPTTPPRYGPANTLADNWTRFHFIFFTTSPSVLPRKWDRGCRNSINLVSGGQNEKCGHACFSQSRYPPHSTLKKTTCGTPAGAIFCCAKKLFRRGRKKSKIRPWEGTYQRRYEMLRPNLCFEKTRFKIF